MKLHLKKGTTSKLLDLFIQDSSSTTGAGLTGLVYNSAGLSAYYYREGAASAVAITLATMTLGTWATGGFVVVDGTNMPGCYQLSVPDAALATGANSVLIILKGATNMAPLVLEVQLTDIDFNDAVRGGMTSLPSSGTLAVNPTLAGVTHTGAVIPTVSTLTGHTAQTGDNYARIGAAGAGLTALGDTRLANLDAAVSTRSTYAGGAVASVTAAVTVGTNNDKTGYSLTQTFPANFSALSITAGGLVDITQAAADKAWSTASRLLTAGTNIVLAKGTGITGFTDVTAAQVSTQVWSEPIPGTFGSGTAGYKLNSAASAGDPWGTALPGAYGAGTAGKIVGDNINATISSRSTLAATDVWAAGTRTLSDKTGFELSAAGVDAILDEVVEGTYTLRQLTRLLASALFAKTSGGGTATLIARDIGDTKARITLTVDANGNRTAVTLDGA